MKSTLPKTIKPSAELVAGAKLATQDTQSSFWNEVADELDRRESQIMPRNLSRNLHSFKYGK